MNVLARVFLSFLAAFALAGSPAVAAVPAGFVDELVTAATGPTAIAFTPDGRLLITRQSGVLIVRQGTTNTTALTLDPATQVCSNFERGLLGVAVDPDFGSGIGENHFIYLYYTYRNSAANCSTSTAPVNRVSRFVLDDTNIVSLASETILVDNMPSRNGNHNGGDVQFGKDGYLYITIGDGGCDWAGGGTCNGNNIGARDQHVLTGKVLRITKDGDIPPTNPFQGAGTARCNVTGQTTPGNRCQETFSWGLRNPFRMAFDPNAVGTRFFINDVGQGSWEEIDLGTSGADYGWNCREGAHLNNNTGPCFPTPAGMVDPIYEYQHGVQIPGTTSTSSCNSITGGAFVPNGIWPPAYDNTYLFSDYICGWIVRLAGANGGGPFVGADFATSLGGASAVALKFGPYLTTQALYYTTFSGGGQVRRIRYTGSQFYSLTPCRLLDTRDPNGPYGGPQLAAGATRAFAASGQCGVPAGATAIVTNLTVVFPTGAGELRIGASGVTTAGTSAISFSPGQTRANNAVVRLSAGGAFDVFCDLPSGGTQFILDIVGYYL